MIKWEAASGASHFCSIYCINGKTVLYLPIYDFNVGKYVDIDTVKSVKFFKIYGGCDESSITCRWIWNKN